MTYPSSIIVDIDGTLCPLKRKDQDYADLTPDNRFVTALANWRDKGYRIVLFTSRNMRTYEGNLGEINKHTAPVLIQWLERHNIEYDEILLGKPWPGPKGFYVDDRSVRPNEFLNLSEDELYRIMEEAQCPQTE